MTLGFLARIILRVRKTDLKYLGKRLAFTFISYRSIPRFELKDLFRTCFSHVIHMAFASCCLRMADRMGELCFFHLRILFAPKTIEARRAQSNDYEMEFCAPPAPLEKVMVQLETNVTNLFDDATYSARGVLV